MNIHKRTRLTLSNREELWKLHCTRKHSQSDLAEIFRVSRQTISKILQRCRGREFVPRSSINKRFKSLQYGLKRLKKVEFEIEKKRS
jgi:DNA-binding MarR family transcriptional regulator